jgi:hypothetical protein
VQVGQHNCWSLNPIKTTVIHALQPCNPASRFYFCSLYLQSVVKGEINPQLTFFSEDTFRLLWYINTQNNCYWSPLNPHLTHEVLSHPVKVGFWCAVSARIVVSVFFNETVNFKRYLCVEGKHFHTSCDLWIVTTSFWTLSVIRHADSLEKVMCASWQAVPQSPWSAEPLNRSTN